MSMHRPGDLYYHPKTKAWLLYLGPDSRGQNVYYSTFYRTRFGSLPTAGNWHMIYSYDIRDLNSGETTWQNIE